MKSFKYILPALSLILLISVPANGMNSLTTYSKNTSTALLESIKENPMTAAALGLGAASFGIGTAYLYKTGKLGQMSRTAKNAVSSAVTAPNVSAVIIGGLMGSMTASGANSFDQFLDSRFSVTIGLASATGLACILNSSRVQNCNRSLLASSALASFGMQYAFLPFFLRPSR